jgi:hypothetical protein
MRKTWFAYLALACAAGAGRAQTPPAAAPPGTPATPTLDPA